jgi:DNA-binding beta-propeller fold protein YncE
MKRLWALSAALLWIGSPPSAGPAASEPLVRRPAPDPALLAPHRRGPIALAISPDGRTLWTANRKSGTISQVDLVRRAVVAEHSAGRGLSSIHVGVDGAPVVCDEVAGQVLVMKLGDGGLTVARRIAVGESPAGSALSRDGTRLFVACLWARRVDVVDLAGGRVLRSAALNFRPRCVVASPDEKHLIAADGFGGKLAVIEAAAGRVVAELYIPGHNIRGMTLSPAGDRLLFTQLILNELETNTHQSVFWGSLMATVVRDLHLPSAITGQPDPLHRSRTYFMGEVHSGSADPYAISFTPAGDFAVTLSGADQLGLFNPAGASVSPRRAGVGARPTGLAVTPDGKFVCTADNLADTVSVVDAAEGKTVAGVALGPMPEPTAVDEGERLFFDGRLSLDRWMSCQSCHTDGHTPGLSADTFGDSLPGSAKRIKSLGGVGELTVWSWTGKFHKLEDQIRSSIRTTQQGREPTGHELAALTAYVRTIPRRPTPAPPPADRAAAERGRAVFERHNCAGCHAGPTLSGVKPVDVGLRDLGGTARFVPPPLLGIAENGPYFHDGRATDLREVFARFRHQVDKTTTAAEIDDLVAYLKGL